MKKDLLISNPFTFKTSLEIALEITSPLLTSTNHAMIKNLIYEVPNSLDLITITISSKEEKQLLNCITAFKQSKTFYWLREDFLLALKDIEKQCKRSRSA